MGEFEDYALMREFARTGHGFTCVPAVLQEQFRREHGFSFVETANAVDAQFFAITLERKNRHPAIAAIIDRAREIFAT